MNIKTSLKNQYHASLAMLRQCIERCPEELWLNGSNERTCWQIADHAAFFAHLYLMQKEDDFVPATHHYNKCSITEYEPTTDTPFTIAQTLEYLEQLDGNLSDYIDRLDLDAEETGFSWYPNMSKIDHVLLNLRHLQGHVGQLSEILMENGVETNWISRPPA